MTSGPANEDLTLRSYVPDDEAAISDLFSVSFGRPIPPGLWQWRFVENPAGPGINELAWSGSRLVAHCGATPVRMSFDGQEIMTALGGSAMTHPQFRGGGLYSRLYRRVLDRMADAGMVFLWAFPDPGRQAHRILARDLGFIDIHEVPRFRLSLGSRNPLPGPGPTVFEAVEFDERFDDLWRRVKRNHGLLTCRDCQYLRWRYLRKPGDRYRTIACAERGLLHGFAVAKRYRDEIQVVDLLTVPDVSVGLQLISALIEAALREGATAVSMWLNVAFPLHRELERYGFAAEGPVCYFGAAPLASESTPASFLDYRRWHLTMGDSDVF